MRPKVSHIRGRKVKSILPLFSGYLFFCGTEKQRLEVLKTNRVANIIEAIDQEKLIKELAQIEQVIKSGLEIQSHKLIKEGQKCRVTSGPLKNTEGIVQKTKTSARLILNVEMLGQAASVEVDMDTIEIID
jgi:transcriptional antiterminator RfaH